MHQHPPGQIDKTSTIISRFLSLEDNTIYHIEDNHQHQLSCVAIPFHLTEKYLS
jgi:hypothetical protein